MLLYACLVVGVWDFFVVLALYQSEASPVCLNLGVKASGASCLSPNSRRSLLWSSAEYWAQTRAQKGFASTSPSVTVALPMSVGGMRVSYSLLRDEQVFFLLFSQKHWTFAWS